MNKKQYWWILLLAVAVGLTFFLRNIILFYGSIKDPQVFFTPFSGGDEDIYAAQIREVFEGKLFSGDAFSYETRTKLPIYHWLSPLILGLMAKAINSVSLLFIIGDFVFPAILFALMVKFIYYLTRQYWASVVTALSTLFLFQVINKFPPVTKTLLQNFWRTITFNPPVFPFFNRLPPPQFTFIIFFLFIISLYYTIVDKSKRLTIPLLTGVLSASLAYIYFYHWSAGVVILAICLGFNLLAKNITTVKKLIIALGTALILSAGYFYQIFSVELADKRIQAGLINSRFFEPLPTLRYGLLSLILFLVIRRQPVRQLFTSIFLAAVILINLQLIIGFTISPGHWPNTTFEPLVVIAGGILLIEIFKKLNWQKILSRSWILIFPIFLYAILNQVSLIQRYGKMYYLSPSEKQLYDWLNQNSSPDSVTLSLNRLINRRLPAITHNYPYLPYGVYSQMNIEKIWERFNLVSSILQLKPEFITWLLTGSNELAGYLFDEAYRYHNLSNLNGLDFPPNEKEIIAKYHPFFSFGYLYIPDNIKQASLDQIRDFGEITLQERICRYRLNYLVLKNFEKEAMTRSLDSNIFELVFQKDDLSLFQVNSDLCQKP